jgi:hypothetical protein
MPDFVSPAPDALGTDQNLIPNPPVCADMGLTETVEPVPTAFNHGDRRYRQVWRQGAVAILEVRLATRDVATSYETVIIQIRKGREQFGKWYGPKEMYPADEDFGTKGWSFPTRALSEQWAQIVITNLDKPRKERTAWSELLHEIWKRSQSASPETRQNGR